MSTLSLKLLANSGQQAEPPTPGTFSPGLTHTLPQTPPLGGQQDGARRRAAGPCALPVFGACFLPSLQLCSEEKNVHYAQNKHSHRPPGWESSSEKKWEPLPHQLCGLHVCIARATLSQQEDIFPSEGAC